MNVQIRAEQEGLLPFKKITIFLVPQGTNSVKQFRVPSSLPLFIALFVLFLFSLFIWTIVDYQALKVQIPRLAQLEKEHQLKEEQFSKSYAVFPKPISVEGYIPKNALTIRTKIVKRKLTKEQKKEIVERLKKGRDKG